MDFNLDKFMNTAIEGANSTELLQVSEGEYTAVSEPVTEKSFQVFDIKNGDKAGQKGVNLIVKWALNDEGGALKEYLGRAPVITQRIFLDVNQAGDIEMGKGRNVALGQLRDVFNLNTGRPFSWSMLGGQVAKVKVKHDLYQGRTQANVVAVTKA